MATTLDVELKERWYPSGRCVVKASGGGLYFVGVDGVADPEAVAVYYSSDGSSWAEKDAANRPAAAGAGDIVFGVSVAIDSSNILHIIFYENGLQFSYTTFDTSTDQYNSGDAASVEQIAVEAAGSTVGAKMVSITVDSSDIPHVAFHDPTAYHGTPYSTIYYTNRIGGSWKAAIEVEGQATQIHCRGPEITVNDSDIPLIVYSKHGTSVFAAAKGDQINATAFTLKDVGPLSSGSSTTIAVDSNGDAWCGCSDAGDKIYIAKQSVNWTDAWTIYGTVIHTGYLPSLAIDGTDVYIFYEDENDNICYLKYSGGWGNQVTVQSGTYHYPRVRWAYNNNYPYTYTMDYVFRNASVYWDAVVFAAPPPTFVPKVIMIQGILGIVALKIVSFLKIMLGG